MINEQFYTDLIQELNEQQVTLVAVSKTHSAEAIQSLYKMGQRAFGENRVQELLEKHPMLPGDIQWHLIGHLQRNKVRQCMGTVSMIESVDSVKLLKEIDKEARKAGVTMDVLLQIRIAEEETKFGFDPETIAGELRTLNLDKMQHVSFRGVMGMASFVDDPDQIREEFRSLKKSFEMLRDTCFQNNPDFNQLSMGMSGDYQIAIEEGSTMVRIGSLIFGERI